MTQLCTGHYGKLLILWCGSSFAFAGQTREFLLLSLSEWDTSAGLASGGSDVGAASLLPPLPHLEELLLLLLAPVAAVFVSKDCLCYCCSACSCNPAGGCGRPSNPEGGPHHSPRNTSVTAYGGRLNEATRIHCCASCLRGAVCYVAVSFGGFREFGFVPRSLWTSADIALLNEARSVLRGIFKPTDIRLEWGGTGTVYAQLFSAGSKGPSDPTKFAGVDYEDDDEDGSESEDRASLPEADFQQHSDAAGLRLDSLLEQLVRPKILLQHKQLLAATTVTTHLRSRRRQESPTTRHNDSPLACSGVPLCWTKLDHAKQQSQQREDGLRHPSSSIAVFDVHGAVVDASGRAETPAAADAAAAPASRSWLSMGEFDRNRPAAAATGTGEAGRRVEEERARSCFETDPLAKAIAETLEYLQAPQASQTAMLPEGAAPSIWGLPASLLLLRHTAQQPPVFALQQVNCSQESPSSERHARPEQLLIQCSNSCCRVPLGVLGDLQQVTSDMLPPGGPSWANLALKYLLKELENAAESATESESRTTNTGVRRDIPGKATVSSGQIGIKHQNYTLQDTFLQWMQETELLNPSVVEEMRDKTHTPMKPELWVLDTEKVSQRSRAECLSCCKDERAVGSPEYPCDRWSCVLRRCFGYQLVPLLDDDKASLAKLKLESRLLLTPSSLAFVGTYLQPLLRTRERLQGLVRIKQEEAFQSEADPADIAQQNRMKQQQSHAVDNLVGWILCGGPISHIVGFRIFQYFVFTRDCLVDVAGHIDAQRVYFWRLASANVVPRGPLDFPKEPPGAPLLSFGEALAMGQHEGRQEGRKSCGLTPGPHDVFFAAAKYIHKYERGVLAEDVQKSAAFVEHLAGIIARRCTWTAEKSHLQDSEMYQKFLLESWDISRSFPGDGSLVAQQSQGYQRLNDNERTHQQNQHGPAATHHSLSNSMQNMLTQISPHLQEGLLPSDIFDWQQRLLEQQRTAILKDFDAALRTVPTGWIDGVWTPGRLVEEQSTIWRWAADEEEVRQQQEAARMAEKKRKAEEEEKKLQEAKARRKLLEREALRALSASGYPL